MHLPQIQRTIREEFSESLVLTIACVSSPFFLHLGGPDPLIRHCSHRLYVMSLHLVALRRRLTRFSLSQTHDRRLRPCPRPRPRRRRRVRRAGDAHAQKGRRVPQDVREGGRLGRAAAHGWARRRRVEPLHGATRLSLATPALKLSQSNRSRLVDFQKERESVQNQLELQKLNGRPPLCRGSSPRGPSRRRTACRTRSSSCERGCCRVSRARGSSRKRRRRGRTGTCCEGR